MKTMKKWLLLFLLVALLLPAGQAFAADPAKKVQVSFAPMHYLIDGVEYTPPSDQLGFLYTNEEGKAYTYVPLRFVASILNRSVAWDPKALKVTVSEPKAPEWQAIQEYLKKQAVNESKIEPVDKTKIKKTTISVSLTKVTYEFNGKTVEPNATTPGFMYNSRLYVPLRFMYESLDQVPAWDPKTYSISTESKPEQIAYRNIVKAADKTIVALDKACTSDITAEILPLASKLLSGKATDEEKSELDKKTEDMFADCKGKLNGLLDNLSKQLTNGGFSTELVDQYREAYDKKEAQLRVLKDKYLKS